VDVNIAVAVLLAVACASVVLTALGVLFSRNVYERLHYLAPAATVGVVAVAAAVVTREGVQQAGIKAVLAAVVLFLMNPILTHATARAARVHQQGYWEQQEPR
jgi:monovalent cation/proton antiporter MnhG/PhaG subunit